VKRVRTVIKDKGKVFCVTLNEDLLVGWRWNSTHS